MTSSELKIHRQVLKVNKIATEYKIIKLSHLFFSLLNLYHLFKLIFIDMVFNLKFSIGLNVEIKLFLNY